MGVELGWSHPSSLGIDMKTWKPSWWYLPLELREMIPDTRVGWPCFSVGPSEMASKSIALWKASGGA